MLSPAVLALGILKEIPKHNGKKRKSTCIITTIFVISLCVDDLMQHVGGGHSAILKVVHWNHDACAGSQSGA